MAGPILLPAPLAANSVALGQLILDPLNPEYKCYNDSPPTSLDKPFIQPNYRNIVAHDDEGHLLTSLGHHLHSPHQNILLVQADQMSYASLKQPAAAFDTLRRAASSQSFLRKMALHRRPLYYVTGIQKLKNPSFKRAVVKEGNIAELPASPDTKLRLPLHTRRDSALELEEAATDAVFGVELRKVKCLVGLRSAPHDLDDIDYEWTYHMLDGEDDVQLAIGLGKALDAAELRALAGIVSFEDFTDDSCDSDSFDDEGLAGFS